MRVDSVGGDRGIVGGDGGIVGVARGGTRQG